MTGPFLLSFQRPVTLRSWSCLWRRRTWIHSRIYWFL